MWGPDCLVRRGFNFRCKVKPQYKLSPVHTDSVSKIVSNAVLSKNKTWKVSL